MKSGMKILVTVIIVVIVILILGIIANVIRNNFIMKKLYESSNELKSSIKIIIMKRILNYQKGKPEQPHIRYIIMEINT